MSSVQRPLDLSDRILGLRHAFCTMTRGSQSSWTGSQGPPRHARPDSIPPGNDHKLRGLLTPAPGILIHPLLRPSHRRPLQTLSMVISRMFDQYPCPLPRGTGNLRSGHPSRVHFGENDNRIKPFWDPGCC
ncbi:hypothetical protein FOIG_01948 [Fusarium odoratissimum NRRL 54006]|uniref:Uncharacterized protein n=2 Tax=Fusarium oxysporum species complex TaxID=171631 RepID=X0KJS6_FUSO5|nr:uncharacterized protein FOIG_01948 [Fusarium odoratissimum NRRL 54006]EXM08921.1 hypothetical protein FOIG_01948 [Fusarium odoratissimum NRRL 54006]TXC05640.1 hypothetical protein FocTR4_00009829 [Fusarium oxysporum f. sp. cubense]